MSPDLEPTWANKLNEEESLIRAESKLTKKLRKLARKVAKADDKSPIAHDQFKLTKKKLEEIQRQLLLRLMLKNGSLGTESGRIEKSEPNLQNIPIRTELGDKLYEGLTKLVKDKDITLSLVAKAKDEFEEWSEKIYNRCWRDGSDPQVKVAWEALEIFRKYFG